MIEKRVSDKSDIYYGVPTREILEGITVNIGDSKLPEGSRDILCLRLRFLGIKSEGDKIIFSNDCWEKICKTEDVSVTVEISQTEIKNLVDQLRDLVVPFGDFEQIIEMLRTKKMV